MMAGATRDSRPDAGQLTFDLGQRPALGREDFLVAPSNEVAVAWIDRWPDWPAPVLALHGPPGAGKSHLGKVWQAASAARAIDPAAVGRVEPPDLLGAAEAWLLDDADRIAVTSDAAQEGLLHLYNLVVERGGALLLIGREAPARWSVSLPDLASRLAAVHAVALGPPDDALIEALLVKLFADRQLKVTAQEIRYLVTHMERSFAAARALVAAIDERALRERRDVRLPLIRDVLRARASDTGATEDREEEL